MPTKAVEKGITRFDISERGTFGYMMRICRRGEKYNEFFADREYKGKRKALLAARKRYQQLDKKLPDALTTKNIKSVRNRSGKVGVHLASTVSAAYDNHEYLSYCASWKTESGSRKKISFAFSKYGKKIAWELACIARDKETTDRARIERLHGMKSKVRKKK